MLNECMIVHIYIYIYYIFACNIYMIYIYIYIYVLIKAEIDSWHTRRAKQQAQSKKHKI